MKTQAAGDRALLVELDPQISVAALHAAAGKVRRIDGVLNCIVGRESLYVVFSRPPDGEAVSKAIGEAAMVAQTFAGSAHRLIVSFRPEDAPDLHAFLEKVDLSRDEFLRDVARLRLVARYIGFRGGFAYLDGWPAEWAMPRRETSRPVPRGSFAIAGATAGFYPTDSPGGWNLLGRTSADLEHRLQPGDVLEIIPTREPLEAAPTPARAPRPALPGLEILAAPLAAVVAGEDWTGIEKGIPEGGAFDGPAAAAARRATGLETSARVLECALAGPRLRASAQVVLSWYGGTADVHVDGRRVGDERQFQVAAGQVVEIGRITGGLRGYLAAGSAPGDVTQLERKDRLVIRVLPGPHSPSIEELVCEVSTQLDRVGIRLRPTNAAGFSIPASLPTCGMQCGTLQLHPDGSLVAMGPDHPVTGGYLQPMTVLWEERWKLAQLSPGEQVRFVAQLP